MNRVLDYLLWAFNRFEVLNPLTRFSPWLLRNAPTLWRMSILSRIWWLIVAHAIALALGFSVTEDEARNIGIDHIAFVQAIVWWVTGLMAGYWAINLVRWPMIDTRLPQLASTWAVTVAVIYGYLVLPNAYLSPLTVKMGTTPATTIERDAIAAQYKRDIETVENIIYGGVDQYRGQQMTTICSGPGRTVSEDIVDELKRISDSLQLDWDGVRPGTESWKEAQAACDDNKDTFAFNKVTSDGFYRSEQFVSSDVSSYVRIILAREFVLVFSSGTALERYVDAITRRSAANVALVAGTGLFLVTFLIGQYGRIFVQNRVDRSLFRRLRRLSPLWSLDQYLLVNHPKIWALRFHRAIWMTTLIVVGLYVIRIQLVDVSELLTLELAIRFGNVAEVTAFFLTPLALAVIMMWLFRFQRRKVEGPEMLETPLTLLAALLVPPLFALTVAMLLVHGWIMDAKNSDPAVAVLAIGPPAILLLAITSMLISYRNLTSGLISLGVGIALGVSQLTVSGLLIAIGGIFDASSSISGALVLIIILMTALYYSSGTILQTIARRRGAGIRFVLLGAVAISVTALSGSISSMSVLYMDDAGFGISPFLILLNLIIPLICLGPFVKDLPQIRFEPES